MSNIPFHDQQSMDKENWPDVTTEAEVAGKIVPDSAEPLDKLGLKISRAGAEATAGSLKLR